MIHLGGQLLTVQVVRRNNPKLAGADGAYYHRRATIYIASDQSPTVREDTLIHELCHAMNSISGMNRIFSDVPDYEEIEERLVESQAPMLRRLLRDCGFVFPKGLLK